MTLEEMMQKIKALGAPKQESSIMPEVMNTDNPVNYLHPTDAPQAMSRFTQTPIGIRPTVGKSEGAYQPNPSTIFAQIPSGASYRDLNELIHHEDIHALRQKENIPYDALSGISPSLMDAISLGFDASSRAGYGPNEYPAYMGAYRPGQVYGVTPEMRQNFIESYSKGLKPNAGKQYKRIADSFNATLRGSRK